MSIPLVLMFDSALDKFYFDGALVTVYGCGSIGDLVSLMYC